MKPAAPPGARTAASALGDSATLQSLLQRVQASKSRWATAREALPERLREHVKPGPLDDQGWTLLAANAAVAAKLRQSLPLIEDAMHRGGWKPTPIRVHLQGR